MPREKQPETPPTTTITQILKRHWRILVPIAVVIIAVILLALLSWYHPR